MRTDIQHAARTEPRTADTLTHGQLELLKTLLLCELAEHIDQHAQSLARIAELTGQTDTDSSFLRETAEAAAARSEEAVQSAKRALVRVEQGSYGTCERCGGRIPFERLEAIPHAAVCVDCVHVRTVSSRLRFSRAGRR